MKKNGRRGKKERGREKGGNGMEFREEGVCVIDFMGDRSPW